jgi:hypothetical protein
MNILFKTSLSFLTLLSLSACGGGGSSSSGSSTSSTGGTNSSSSNTENNSSTSNTSSTDGTNSSSSNTENNSSSSNTSSTDGTNSSSSNIENNSSSSNTSSTGGTNSNNGSGGRSSIPGTNSIGISQKAFNKFDASTFSASTCTNLPLEIPVGIFVSLDGSSNGLGTQGDPLDLVTALSSSSPAQPGQTIWIKEGVYEGSFEAKLSGTSGNPISIKPLPGQRVLINSHNSGSDRAGLTITGQWTDFYGIEATSSDPYRGSITERYPDVKAKAGITVLGANTNIYNALTYDNVCGGIDFWKTARDSTLHGNIIYNNGFAHSGRGACHGIYTQNTTGYKHITNNIIFFGFQTGLHPYSTATAPINNFTIENNVWFLAGASDPRDNQQKTNLIIYTKSGVRNLIIKNNKGYSQVNRGSSITSDDVSGSAQLIDNYLVERLEVYDLWDQFDLTGNTIYGNIDQNPNNIINDISDNTFSTSRPSSGNKIFVDANGIAPRRGRIVIYNYDNADSVSVNLSSILKNGEAYRIHSVMGLFQEALVSGVYNGSNISIPMGTIDPPQPNGNPNGIDSNDGPKKKFGTFIVTHGGCL